MVTAIINQMSYSYTQGPKTDQYPDIAQPPHPSHDKLANCKIVQLITLIVISVCTLIDLIPTMYVCRYHFYHIYYSPALEQICRLNRTQQAFSCITEFPLVLVYV